jgi:hypothetical protein
MLQLVIIVIAVLQYVCVKCHKEQDAVTKNDKELVCTFIVLSHLMKVLKGTARGM